VLKENGQQIVKQLERYSSKSENYVDNGYQLFKSMKVRRIKDIKNIDSKYQTLIDKI
jgi:5S rRNA maturation endonuclease (ribonuclease M5)